MNRLLAVAVTLSFLTLASHPAAADDAERLKTYQTFREHFDARRFMEAMPAAEELVLLSEQQFGKDQLEVIVPLLNLATTQLRTKNYILSEATYLRALKIAESREGGFARSVIRPLLGLGVTYAAADQHAEAVSVLRRAVEVSRRVDGLFNDAQLELLDPLVESYIALDQQADADREQQYTIRLSESAYGRDDLRMLPPLLRMAHWYEEANRYFSARRLIGRAMEIVQKASSENDVRMVEPLRALAETYRLEYQYGIDEPDGETGISVQHSSSASIVGGSQLENAGRSTLQRALKILKDQKEPVANPADIAAVQMEIADWHQMSGDWRTALKTYKEVWQALSALETPSTAVFDKAQQVFYRGPTGTMRKPPHAIQQYDQFFVTAKFTVTAEGTVADLKVTDKNASADLEKSVVKAMEKARYRPRFVNGEPVATQDMERKHVLYIKKETKKTD